LHRWKKRRMRVLGEDGGGGGGNMREKMGEMGAPVGWWFWFVYLSAAISGGVILGMGTALTTDRCT
jgi:hypothetical protein